MELIGIALAVFNFLLTVTAFFAVVVAAAGIWRIANFIVDRILDIGHKDKSGSDEDITGQ